MLKSRVVSFLPALTFPSRAGISPHGSAARVVSRLWVRGCPGSPKPFRGEWAGENPKKSPRLSLAPSNTRRVPAGDCPRGCGDQWAPPWCQHVGLGKKPGFTPLFQSWGLFVHGAEAAVPAVSLGLGSSSPLQLRASLLSPAVPILLFLGHPRVPSRESHQQPAEHGAEHFGGDAWVLCPLRARVQEPGAPCPAQRGKSHHALHQMHDYTKKRNNTHKTRPFDIRV